MSQPVARNVRHEAGEGSLGSYVTGFISSIVLTLLAFFATQYHWLSGWALIGSLCTLALAQLIVQLWFFLHLGAETKPRYNLLVFSFMALIVGILVIGSIWIMTHLNYHMHGSPEQIDQSIVHDENYDR